MPGSHGHSGEYVSLGDGGVFAGCSKAAHFHRRMFAVDPLDAAAAVTSPVVRRQHAAPAVWTQFLSEAPSAVVEGWPPLHKQAEHRKRHATEFLLGWLWTGHGSDAHGDQNDNSGQAVSSDSEVKHDEHDNVASTDSETVRGQPSKSNEGDASAEQALARIKKEVDEVKAAAAKLEAQDPQKDDSATNQAADAHRDADSDKSVGTVEKGLLRISEPQDSKVSEKTEDKADVGQTAKSAQRDREDAADEEEDHQIVSAIRTGRAGIAAVDEVLAKDGKVDVKPVAEQTPPKDVVGDTLPE